MRKGLTAICASLVLSFAITAGAQTDARTDEQSKGQVNNKAVTLTGCLVAGTQANTYILQNATMPQRARQQGAPVELARAESSYLLVPQKTSLDLQAHVGHKVSVTGKIAGEGSAMSQPNVPQSSQSESNLTRFDVNSIKHLSNTCP